MTIANPANFALLNFKKETYPSQGCEDNWQKEWGEQIYFSHVAHYRRGVATLFWKGFDCEVKSSESGDQGRWICIDVLHSEKKLLLLNIYAPNTSNENICFL